MKLLTYASTIHDLNLIKEAEIQEVIIGIKDLSRFATSDLNAGIELMNKANELGLRVVLEWDALFTENQFSAATQCFNSIPSDNYAAIRVQDIGVLQYIIENSDKPIQFIAETGNHNLTGLITWKNYIGKRLERIVLSIELSKEKLKEYCQHLECPVEYLGLGRILLFYSPRNLLSPLLKDQDVNLIGTDRIEALGESEESPHKGFPLIQNQHGTFMFHVKDLFLLDRWAELKETGLNYLRIDLRFEQDRALLKEISKIQNDFTVGESVKALYQKDVIRGYYQINKSDVLFKKLKNYRIQRKDESYVGEVIEISKGQYLAISIKSDTSLRIDEQLKFITPEGKEYFCKVHTLRDSSYTERLSSEGKSLILMNYMGGVWPKSQVYLAQ